MLVVFHQKKPTVHVIKQSSVVNYLIQSVTSTMLLILFCNWLHITVRFILGYVVCRLVIINNNNNKIEKWAYFIISEKSWNSMPFLLIIAVASKQHKRMPQKVFHANMKALGYFLGMVCVRSIRGFREFPVDPYYEPLAWFMIHIYIYIYIYIYTIIYPVIRYLCRIYKDFWWKKWNSVNVSGEARFCRQYISLWLVASFWFSDMCAGNMHPSETQITVTLLKFSFEWYYCK